MKIVFAQYGEIVRVIRTSINQINRLYFHNADYLKSEQI